jgi:hypothetical protein
MDENGLPVCTRVSLEDGNLIAAAPDLLDALEGCVKAYDKTRATIKHADLWPDPKWIGDSRAAIAKAKGA